MPYYDTVTKVLETVLNITPSAWTAIRYGDDNAVGRKYLGVYNKSPYKLYITTNSSVGSIKYTKAIRAGGERIFPYSDKVTLYARSGHATGCCRVIVTEECG